MSFSLLLATTLTAPAQPPIPVPAAAASVPSPRYFMILFGGQGVPFRPRTAHTWATYVKVTPTISGDVIVEPRTISWMPEQETVRPLRPVPERGKNCTLDETLAIMAAHNVRVSYWGPYEIDAARYRLACEQIDRLNGGGVQYRFVDSAWMDRDISHCAHAVTYADPAMKRLIQPVVRVGEPGTSVLAARYRLNGAFVNPEVTHDWLVPYLGLDRAGLVRREPGEWIPREFW
jgi:hypothetical protein